VAYFESMDYWAAKEYLKESTAYDLKYPKKESSQQTQISKGESKAVTEDSEIVWDDELEKIPVKAMTEEQARRRLAQINEEKSKVATQDSEIVWDDEPEKVPVKAMSEKRKRLIALVKLKRDRLMYSDNAETAWWALLWPALAIIIPYLFWPLVIAGRWVWRGKP
jgi:hypothetical protein